MTCKCLTWHLLTANPVTLVTDRLGIKVRSQRSGGFVPRAVRCNLIGLWPRWCTHHRKLNYHDCHPESHTAHLSCLHPPSLHSSSHLLLCFASLLHLFMSSLVSHFWVWKRKGWVETVLKDVIAVSECRWELKEYPKMKSHYLLIHMLCFLMVHKWDVWIIFVLFLSVQQHFIVDTAKTKNQWRKK